MLEERKKEEEIFMKEHMKDVEEMQ